MVDKKTEIVNCGKELFSSRGYKDTNVSDITKSAGIAVGTFYNYYSSKEKLFMEIFLEENVRLKKSILEAVDLDGEPSAVIMEVISLNANGIASNPILKEWYNRDVFDKIEQRYREENGIKHLDFMYDSFYEIIKGWQAKGKMRGDISSELIMAIFAAIINADTHKEEIGIEFFPDILSYLTEFVIKGLTP